MFTEAQAVVETFTAGSPWQVSNLAYISGRTGQQAKAEQN